MLESTIRDNPKHAIAVDGRDQDCPVLRTKTEESPAASSHSQQVRQAKAMAAKLRDEMAKFPNLVCIAIGSERNWDIDGFNEPRNDILNTLATSGHPIFTMETYMYNKMQRQSKKGQ